MIRLPSRSTIFPCTTLFRSYFSCSLWLSPHFRRKFCVRIAQERRLATRSTHSTSAFVFYEKVIKVKADVAALLTFLVLCGFRHISGENFALGSLRSDDWQLGRPTAPPLLSVFRVFRPPNASSSVLYRPGAESRFCTGRARPWSLR